MDKIAERVARAVGTAVGAPPVSNLDLLQAAHPTVTFYTNLEEDGSYMYCDRWRWGEDPAMIQHMQMQASSRHPDPHAGYVQPWTRLAIRYRRTAWFTQTLEWEPCAQPVQPDAVAIEMPLIEEMAADTTPVQPNAPQTDDDATIAVDPNPAPLPCEVHTHEDGRTMMKFVDDDDEDADWAK